MTTERPNGEVNAKEVLANWYGEQAIYVNTVRIFDEKTGIGILKVTEEHCSGHLKDNPIWPGHQTAEFAAQTAGVIALSNLGEEQASGLVPLFGEYRVQLTGIVVPGDILLARVKLNDTKNKRLDAEVTVFKITKDDDIEI